jgi:indole-3-glycerol phosphate synthase
VGPGGYLEAIVASRRARAARLERSLAELRAAAERAPGPRGFAAALEAAEGLAVVAEVKRRSPSKGDIDPGLDPAAVASHYAAGGASCLSVLTDTASFGALPGDLAAAREAVALPVLRKDFTVCEADVLETRAMGADAVLLIVAALDPDELGRLHRLAAEVGLDALVEVHDRAELECALSVGASLVGVNQRDLRSFDVDRHRAAELAAALPPGVTAVAESGIAGAAEARALAAAGYRAVLVGESLLRRRDRAEAVAELRGHPVAGRPAPAGRGA